ncbi:MAG: hypothetical protein IKJ81_00515 [Bacteroidales bacterium]|nr:hypothetical protein [Bacteroidales bacterium]
MTDTTGLHLFTTLSHPAQAMCGNTLNKCKNMKKKPNGIFFFTIMKLFSEKVVNAGKRIEKSD